MAYAHSPNDRRQWHDLVEHLRGVAELTADFAEPLGAREAGYYLGLWHDVGKFDPEWQTYLQECVAGRRKRGTGPDHKAAGAEVARPHGRGLLSLLVQGHHGGLDDANALSIWLSDKGSRPGAKEAVRRARSAVADLEPTTPIALPPRLQRRDSDPRRARRAVELFVRLLYSALVDADSLDTERHESQERAAARASDVTIEELWARFQQHHATLPQPASAVVQDARVEIYRACLDAAKQPPGLFRLAAPTGGGKTLSAMAFALRHALIHPARHGRRRVIVAVPFITITEQTADAYRRAFADDNPARPIVLEHHSGSRDRRDGADEPPEGDFRPGAAWAQLAAENWDAPVVVTTTVQLFESLFARGRTACRKLHRLVNAVIILDEAQALPPELLEPILDVLRELTANYGTTVLLSTATQPAFEAIRGFADLDARDVLPDPARLFRALDRVVYHWDLDRSLSWDEAAELLREEPRALAILNTKKDALALLDALGDPDAFHLSTLLCGAHRRRVLAEVKARLAAGAPCRLVATQVVEAGVDLDFPFVLRALGPLDAIIQAAGRCNREGQLPNRGRTIVFRPAEGGIPPGVYKMGRAITEAARVAAAHQGRHLDPNDPDVFQDWSRALFALATTDREDIQGFRERLDYPSVATRFRMIDDDTRSVVVPYAGEYDTVARLLAELRRSSRQGHARHLLRESQPFVVSVREREAARHAGQGLLTEVATGIWEWHGRYDDRRGLVADGIGPDQLVW